MHRRTRAILLGILVALSAFTAFPLGAQASPQTPDSQSPSNANDTTVADQVGSDASLASGETYWQGWTLEVDASGIISGDNRDLEVWLVTDEGQLSQQVATVTADEEGMAFVETSNLNGRYVLRYNDQPVYVQDGDGYLESPPDGTEVTVETSTFRVQRQTLSLAYSDPEVFPGQATSLTITSNREELVAAISAGNLTFENLTSLVPSTAYAENYDARAGRDQLLIDVSQGTPIRLNTTVLAPGTAQFTIRVSDTTARVEKALTVKNPAADRRFVSVERREQVGDVINVELRCSTCHLVVGTPEQGVIDILELRDGNGDGRIQLRINTRYAGLYTGTSGYQSNVRQYTSPTDEVERYSTGTELEQIEEELSYAVDTAGKLRDRLGLNPVGRYQPLEPGRLQLTVASSDFLIPRSAWGDRAPYGSELVIRDETDARTIELRPNSFDGIEVMAAPGGDGFEPTAEALRAGAASRDTIALGDRLVFRIDISGLFGYLDAAGASIDSFQRNKDEGIDLALHRLDNSDERLLFERVSVQFVPAPSNDALYVIFGTGDDRLNFLDQGRYRLTLSLEGVSSQHEFYSTRNAYTGYPYLPPGSVETVSAVVELEPAEATITDPSAGTTTRLNPNGTFALAGTTTLAAGSDLNVHITAVEYAWEASRQTTADEQGQWTVLLDLSEAPGEMFEVTVLLGDEVLEEGSFTVLPPEEGTVTPGTSNGESTPGSDGTTNGDGSDDSNGETNTPGQGDGTIVPGIPNVALFGGAFFFIVIITILARIVL